MPRDTDNHRCIPSTLQEIPPVHTPGLVEQEILRSIRQIVRGLRSEARFVLGVAGLSPSGLLCLNAIRAAEPASQREIATVLCLQPPTVVGILDRLCAAGLTIRERSTTDRRRMEVRLTPKGIEVVDAAPVPLQFQFLRALASRPLAERQIIARSLATVANLMAPTLPETDGPAAPILSPEVNLAAADPVTTDT